MIRVACEEDVIEAVAHASKAYAAQDRGELLEDSLRANINGTAFVVCGESIYVLAGFTKVNNKVAYVWAVTTEHLRKKYVSASKELRRFIDLVQQREGIHRVEAYIRCDLESAQRWIEFLGFERESRLYKYNEDGTDSYMYRRIR